MLGNWTYQHALPFVYFPILAVLSFSRIFCDAVDSPPFLLWAHVLNHFSCVWLFATLWTVAHQAPLSMRFSRREYWSGLPCLCAGNLLNPGTEPECLLSPALAGRFFTTSTTFCLMWHLHSQVSWVMQNRKIKNTELMGERGLQHSLVTSKGNRILVTLVAQFYPC